MKRNYVLLKMSLTKSKGLCFLCVDAHICMSFCEASTNERCIISVTATRIMTFYSIDVTHHYYVTWQFILNRNSLLRWYDGIFNFANVHTCNEEHICNLKQSIHKRRHKKFTPNHVSWTIIFHDLKFKVRHKHHEWNLFLKECFLGYCIQI